MVGVFKEARSIMGCTRESSLHMPKELTFQQSFRQGRTVANHEFLAGTRTQVVERPGDQLFPGSGASGYQRRLKQRGNTTDPGKHFQHSWASTHHALKLTGLQQLVVEFLGMSSRFSLLQ